MSRKPLLPVLIGSLLIVSILSLIVKPTLAIDYTNVTVSEAKAMIDTEPFLVLLDVRNQSEYDSGHIRNAKLIPLFELQARLNELNKSDAILVYCKAGARSAQASQILVNNSFPNVYNMVGGITAWMNEAYPIYVKYPSIQEAINNATEGNTIFVSSGLYTELLTVNKSIVLQGENRDTTIVDGSNTGTIFNITADNVSISDITIQHSGCICEGYCGVYIGGQHRKINVTNNQFIYNSIGINLDSAQEVSIASNSFSQNTISCVSVSNSSDILMLRNNMTNNFDLGVEIVASESVIVTDNAILNSRRGISVEFSSNNTFFGNTLSSNAVCGMNVWNCENNLIFHNSFLTNSRHTYTDLASVNFWDNGYASGGNYWDNYTEADRYAGPYQNESGSDGIGDKPYSVDVNNMDHYPLSGTFSCFSAIPEYYVQTICNSTISAFQYNGTAVSFNVSGEDGTNGFCRACIPKTLIDGGYRVIVNGTQIPHTLLSCSNSTHSYLYFTYAHSTEEVLIMPEFPSFLILPLFMVATLLAVTILRKEMIGRHRL